PALRLATGAVTVAQFDGSHQAALSRVIEERCRFGGMVGRGGTQGFRHRGCINDLARIQYPLRVENVLDVTESLIDDRPEQPLVPLAAHHAVAVLARE